VVISENRLRTEQKEKEMTTAEKLINRKLSLLDLAEYLSNVSEACRIHGVSRQNFYDIRKAYEDGGIEGLREKSRRKPNVKNRVDPEVEKRVLAYALEYPTYGQMRVSNELRREGILVSPGGVRSIWLRHDQQTMGKRLRQLEEEVAKAGGVLTEFKKQALEKARTARQNDVNSVDTAHPGYLVGQDTFYVGTLKGVGRIYMQSAIDTYSNVGFGKLYTSKVPVTSADLLNDRVLPFFEEQGVPVLRIITDRGSEFRGNPDTHHYELFLQMNDIEHTVTKTKSPQTNGICERFHQTVLNEFFRVAFRKRFYSALEEIQEDLDGYVHQYNTERTNQGARCQGRTPMQTFTESLTLVKEKMLDETMADSTTCQLLS
jgi:transposase InsO family protein